jgi:CRISPR-associated exonuclease Cas4
MLHGSVPCGAIFYAKTGRRLEIAFDEKLRTETREAGNLLHRIVRSGKTPQVRYEKKCNKCSLLSMCMPKITGSRRSIRSYAAEALAVTDGEKM